MLLSIVMGLVSVRGGVSFLIVFLAAGMLAGEEGILGLQFNDFVLSFWVANVGLALILLDGRLRTSFSIFRVRLKPSLWLATGGFAVCAGITGLAATLNFGKEGSVW